MTKRNNANESKEFAPSVGFWPTKSGKGYRTYIDDNVLEQLAKAQFGGSLFIQEVSEEVREKNDKVPHFRIVIFPPDEEQKSTQRI